MAAVPAALDDAQGLDALPEVPLRALVVDDNPGDQYFVQRLLLRLGLEVQVASDSDDALSLAQIERPDIVFVDVILPGQSGMAIASEIRRLYPKDYIPVVFITSLTDDNVILECFASGGDDVMTKPVNEGLLRARISAALRTRNLHGLVANQRDQLLKYKTEMQRDVNVAKMILDNFATEKSLASANVRHLLRPMETLNGDFIMAAQKPTGSQCFLLGDFTGHGLPAAIGVLVVHGIFCSMAGKGFDVESIAHEINRKMHSLLPTDRFLSGALFELDPNVDVLTVWNAGLPPLLLRSADGRVRDELRSRFLPFGVLPPDQYKGRALATPLRKGDSICAYSDGVIETTNPGGDMFGQQRLVELVTNTPNDVTDRLEQELGAFMQGAAQRDDISFLEVRHAHDTAHSARHDTDCTPVRRAASDWRMTLEFDLQTLRSLDPVTAVVGLAETLQGFGPRATQIYLILNELYGDTVDVGLLGLLDAPGTAPLETTDYFRAREERLSALEQGSVRLELQHRRSATGGILNITASHDGPQRACAADANSIGAQRRERRLELVRSLCDSLEFSADQRETTARYTWVATVEGT